MVMGVPTEALQKLFELAYKDKGGKTKQKQKTRRRRACPGNKTEHLTPSLPNPISSSNFVCFK
jgi:hypothetical protein